MAKKPSKSNVLPYTPKKQVAAGGKAVPPDSGVPRQDDARVMALDLPRGQLSPAMEAYFQKCQEKLGFVPNVLLAYAFDNAKLEAFAAFYNDLMLAPSGLSKLEREMIAVVVSAQNRCYYCLTAHGAAVRTYSGDPALGEKMVMNYRAAKLTKKQRAMLDFAVKITVESSGDRGRGSRRTAPRGFLRSGYLRHRRSGGVFQYVEPGGERDRYAPERGLSWAGEVGAVVKAPSAPLELLPAHDESGIAGRWSGWQRCW